MIKFTLVASIVVNCGLFSAAVKLEPVILNERIASVSKLTRLVLGTAILVNKSPVAEAEKSESKLTSDQSAELVVPVTTDAVLFTE